MTFAFSRQPLIVLREQQVRGNWKYLDKAIFDIPEERAARACVELATHLRLLDDQDAISDYLKKTSDMSFGLVQKENSPDEVLYLRDLTNKVIHAKSFRWNFDEVNAPKLICESNDKRRWLLAEINVVSLAVVCGHLAS